MASFSAACGFLRTWGNRHCGKEHSFLMRRFCGTGASCLLSVQVWIYSRKESKNPSLRLSFYILGNWVADSINATWEYVFRPSSLMPGEEGPRISVFLSKTRQKNMIYNDPLLPSPSSLSAVVDWIPWTGLKVGSQGVLGSFLKKS